MFRAGHHIETADDGGAPLLLLHAWGESWGSFARLIASLPALEIVTPDLGGHGCSDKPETGYSLPEVADDVVAFLHALGIAGTRVLGSSSGGYVAQQLAKMHPEFVESLILVGSPRSLRGRPPFANEVEALRDPISEDWVRNSLSWYRLLHTVPAEYIEDRVNDGLAMPASIWKASLRGFFEATPPTEAGNIFIPTLILRGAHDHLLPRSHPETLAKRIPGSQIKITKTPGTWCRGSARNGLPRTLCGFSARDGWIPVCGSSARAMGWSCA